METFLSVLLEIVKLTIPALVVFLTVYYLLRQYFQGQAQMKLLEMKESQHKVTLPLKLQAYERLTLFCERIQIPNLILRLRAGTQTVRDLRLSLSLAIQQEFEHNLTQQIFVSDNLWKIILIARDQTLEVVNNVADGFDPSDNAQLLQQALLEFVTEKKELASNKALQAIRKEAGLLF